MSNQTPAADPDHDLSREELMSAHFANMVVQQTNMTLVFLGKVPHPETGKTDRDLHAARIFIDQLDMIAFKTRGNLSKEEERLIQQSLMTLRMTFVEAVEKENEAEAKNSASPQEVSKPGPSPEIEPAPGSESATPAESGSAADESKKRFSKKY